MDTEKQGFFNEWGFQDYVTVFRGHYNRETRVLFAQLRH